MASLRAALKTSPLFEIALVLVRLRLVRPPKSCVGLSLNYHPSALYLAGFPAVPR